MEYATSCSNQLNSVASNGEKHYKEVPFDFILDTKKEIEKVLKEGLTKGINIVTLTQFNFLNKHSP